MRILRNEKGKNHKILKNILVIFCVIHSDSKLSCFHHLISLDLGGDLSDILKLGERKWGA